MRRTWIVPVWPSPGARNKAVAARRSRRALDEVAERQDVRSDGDVALEDEAFSGKGGGDEPGADGERQRKAQEDHEAHAAGALVVREEGGTGDHGGGAPQPLNMLVVDESIWSAAVMTLEFIS